MKNCFKWMLLPLLFKPAFGFGQQAAAPTLESLAAAAQQAQASHDYAAAANDYKQAVKIEPNMPELWANLGLMQQQAGDIPAAILSFQRANALNPALYVPNLFLGIDFVHTGKAPQAISFLTKAEKSNKTDPQAPLALGRAYFAIGQFSQAARQFALATTLDPTLETAWYALGISQLNQVETDSRKISIENKGSAFSSALYAESLEKQSRFREAANLYLSLFDSPDQPPCMHSELGFLLLRHSDITGAATEFANERAAHPECSLALLGQARIAIEHGDHPHALGLLQQLWGRDHGFILSNATLLDGLSGDATTAIAGYLTQQGTAIPMNLRNVLLAVFNGSGQTFDESHDTIPPQETSAPSAPESGTVHKTAEQFYAAGEYTQCARKLNLAAAAGSADKLKLLAACAYFSGDSELASNAATTLKTLQPHSPEALYWSIRANERLAIQSLARFQQLGSDSSSSHILLGDIYDQLQRFDDAEAEYNKALTLTPGDPAAMLGLASVYLSNNKIDKAMATASDALKHSPEDPELNLVMADALVDTNKFAEAEPFLMKSLSVKPQMLSHVHAILGRVYAETGRSKEAIDQLKMAESSDEDGSLHYRLALLYRQIGDAKDASAAFDQAKTIKDQQRERGAKLIEYPRIDSLESQASVPGR